MSGNSESSTLIPSSSDTATAKSPDRPFCVGEEVVVVKQAHGAVPKAGTITSVVRIDCQGSVWLKDSGCTQAKYLAHAPDSPKAEYELGDVVECEWEGKSGKGIVFNHDNGELCITDYGDFGKWVVRVRKAENITKIGHASVMPTKKMYYREANEFAKAYFSTPTFTGTYAERQEQWIEHHGIKVGSKVKVVRKFDTGDDGWKHTRFDFNTEKEKMQGTVCYINNIAHDFINIKVRKNGTPYSFPYFALEPA